MAAFSPDNAEAYPAQRAWHTLCQHCQDPIQETVLLTHSRATRTLLPYPCATLLPSLLRTTSFALGLCAVLAHTQQASAARKAAHKHASQETSTAASSVPTTTTTTTVTTTTSAEPAPTVEVQADPKETDPATESPWIIGDRRPHKRAHDLSLSIGVWPPDSLTGAFWYAIPIVPNGLIPAINDAFALELGTAIAGYFDGPDHGAIIPAIGVRWSFFITRRWVPFATLKLAARFGLGPYEPSWFDLNATVGAFFHLADHWDLRLEAGYPTGLSVGLAFLFGD